MDYVYKALLAIHITTGFCSLILFWLPVFTKKGGKTHRLTGKWYVRLMWAVVISAALMSVRNLAIGNTTMGAFLGFISLITANPLWYGMAVLKNKRGVSMSYRRVVFGLNLALVVAAFALIGYGIALGGKDSAVLMFIFGGLGLTALPDVVSELRNPATKVDWMKQHIVGLLTSGIAAYTAFFVFGASQFFSELLSGYWAVIPWVAPTVVGTVGIRRMVRKYAGKGAKG